MLLIVAGQDTVSVDRNTLTIDTIDVEVLAGPDAGKTYRTPADKVSIGTAPTNDVVLTDETVSRYHLELERREGGIRLVDHGSKNGSIVNGIAIESGRISPGSKVRLGHTIIAITDGGKRQVELFESERMGRLVGKSDSMRKLMATIARVARSEASVLICGETGTGKEVVARELHERSPRSGQAFEVVDCGAVLPTLIASELFGHEKGAFTGAERQHMGAFERADGGTLFLDEIGELPPSLQSTLLGALERRQFHRVGGSAAIRVDVRLLCATNRDLRQEVNIGSFRQDLYYRIAVVPLRLPPLRERPQDIPLLAEHFLRKVGTEQMIAEILTPKVLDALSAHYWPGNIRELKNTIEAAVATDEPPMIQQSERVFDPDVLPSSAIDLDPLVRARYEDAKNELLQQFEVAYLNALLERNKDNVTRSAQDSGLHRSYLTKLLRRHRMQVRSRMARED